MEACKIGTKFMKCPQCIVKFDSKKHMRCHVTKMHLTKVQADGKRAGKQTMKRQTVHLWQNEKTQIFRTNYVIN